MNHSFMNINASKNSKFYIKPILLRNLLPKYWQNDRIKTLKMDQKKVSYLLYYQSQPRLIIYSYWTWLIVKLTNDQ